MALHRFHPPEEDVILFDDCPGCERHTRDLGLSLDAANWRAMWERMLEAEFFDGRYRTDAEATLGRQMYYVAVALERYALQDPRELLDAVMP